MSDTNEATPRPWVISPSKYDWVIERDGRGVLPPVSPSTIVADCYGSPWIAQDGMPRQKAEQLASMAKANASLIVRAVNSYDALEDVLKMLDGAACVERRGAAHFIREKLGLMPAE